MSWNYRVIRTTAHGETLYQVAEVYYDAHGAPEGWCRGSLDNWTTLEDLRGTHTLMAAAFEKPVLDETAFPSTPTPEEPT